MSEPYDRDWIVDQVEALLWTSGPAGRTCPTGGPSRYKEFAQQLAFLAEILVANGALDGDSRTRVAEAVRRPGRLPWTRDMFWQGYRVAREKTDPPVTDKRVCENMTGRSGLVGLSLPSGPRADRPVRTATPSSGPNRTPDFSLVFRL